MYFLQFHRMEKPAKVLLTREKKGFGKKDWEIEFCVHLVY